MNQPSTGQILSTISVLMNNADWEDVSPALLQKIVDEPHKSGRAFTDFLKQGAHAEDATPTVFVTTNANICPINRETRFDPMGYGSVIEQDQRSLKLREIDTRKIEIVQGVSGKTLGEQWKELKEQSKKDGTILLDAQVWNTLWGNPHMIPKSLEKTKPTLCFPGTLLEGSNGRFFFSIYWRSDDKGWPWGTVNVEAKCGNKIAFLVLRP